MRRGTYLRLLLVLLMVFMAACEETGAPSTSGQEPVPEANEPVELVFWSMWSEQEPQAVVIQNWFEQYEAEHSNVTFSPVWNGRQNQTIARTALQGGTTIDFMDLDADPLAGGLVADGMGLPLNDFLDSNALDEEVPLKDVFAPGTLDIFEKDGNVYLLPYVYNTIQFWYNKAAFAEVGVEPPNNWDEFLAVNDALLAGGYAPIAQEGDNALLISDWLTYYVTRAKGAGFLLETIEDPTGEMWNDPIYIDTVNAIRDLWDRGHIPEESAGYLWPQGQQTLALGESAMEVIGSWLPIEVRDLTADDFEWGAFNFPTVPGGVGQQTDLEVALLAFMVFEDTEHPEQVLDFLKFVMTKENAQQMADDALVGVTRKDVQWPAELADGATAAANATALMGLTDGALALHAEFVNNVVWVNWRNAFLGEITAEEFVNTMSEATREYWASN